jgi:hypothetical protein
MTRPGELRGMKRNEISFEKAIWRIPAERMKMLPGESFARVDHTSGLYIKGFLGAGGIPNGRRPHDVPLSKQAFTPLPLFSNQIFAHSSDLKVDMVRAGLNYRFGGSDVSPSGDPIMPLKAAAWKASPSISSNWEVETGARLWLSSGTLGDPNPFTPSHYGSRLTFHGLDAISSTTKTLWCHAR